MSDLKGVKPGDELLLIRQRQEPQAVTVEKVGRKLIHIPRYGKPGGETDTFLIATGRRNDNYRHTYLISREDYEARRRRTQLMAALREHGIDFNGSAPERSPETLEALLKVLDADA